MSTRTLTPDERRQWGEKINRDVKASPIVPADAGTGANDPYHIRVLNGQWDQDPSKPTLVIQVTKRVDIAPQRAVEVLQHALVDVFGPHPGPGVVKEYRDVAELKKRLREHHIVSEAHDTLTVIFPPGPIVYTRKVAAVRNAMAAALKKWHEASSSW